MSDLPPEELVKALRAVANAWSAHAEAVERVNAAIPDLEATRAERAVYDERYRASEQCKREMYGAAFEFAKMCAETDAAALIERLEAREKLADIEILGARMVLENKAINATEALANTGWRPSRSHVEGMRNTMVEALNYLRKASKYLAQGEGR